jgi:ABC-type Fe3+/spermidine/putrescine transport system ATPase subunit
MSHRVIVMQAGRIEQIGTPEDLYQNPRTRFASESLGKVNALPARLTQRATGNGTRDRVRAEVAGIALTLEASTVHEAVAAGDRLQLIIRPERIELLAQMPAPGDNVVEGIVAACVFGGDHREYRIALGSCEIIAKADARIVLGNGERIYVRLPVDDLMAVPDDGDPATNSLTE